jgi:hypothetical protein
MMARRRWRHISTLDRGGLGRALEDSETKPARPVQETSGMQGAALNMLFFFVVLALLMFVLMALFS